MRGADGEPDPAEPEASFTVPELAGMAGLTKMTIYRMVHAGELRCVRVGRVIRIPASAARGLLGRAGGDLG